jgi:membrane protein DedA with SNARE-associated domain
MTELVANYAGRPDVLLLILFLTPFVLEEAALLTAASVATTGILSPVLAITPILLGIIISDWFLYGIGHLAGRSLKVRRCIGEERLAKGKRILDRKGTFAAAVTARLVPWLLLPIYVASGVVGVRFRHFAPINAAVAAVHAILVFILAYEFNSLLVEYFRPWIVAVTAIAGIALIISIRWLIRRLA